MMCVESPSCFFLSLSLSMPCLLFGRCVCLTSERRRVVEMRDAEKPPFVWDWSHIGEEENERGGKKWVWRWHNGGKVYIGSDTNRRRLAHYTAVMTSARRLVMDCISLRLYSPLAPFVSFRLDESDQYRHTEIYIYRERENKKKDTRWWLFCVRVCGPCAFIFFSFIAERREIGFEKTSRSPRGLWTYIYIYLLYFTIDECHYVYCVIQLQTRRTITLMALPRLLFPFFLFLK